MAVTYGYEVQPENDPIIDRAREVIEISNRVLAPERAALLAMFPFRTCQRLTVTFHSLSHLTVEYLPSWFPGAADRRLAPYCRKIIRQTLDEPFEIAKENVVCSSPLSLCSVAGRRLDGCWTAVIYRSQVFERGR